MQHGCSSARIFDSAGVQDRRHERPYVGSSTSPRESRGAARRERSRCEYAAVVAGEKLARHFAAHKLDERFHLRLHLRHLVAHVQNDFDAGQIHAQLARQIQNHFQPLQVLIGVKPRVALRTRRLQQAHALVEPQRLRMQLVQLRDRADHVAGFRSFLWDALPSIVLLAALTPSRARKISRRGSSRLDLARVPSTNCARARLPASAPPSALRRSGRRASRTAAPKARPFRAAAVSCRCSCPAECAPARARRSSALPPSRRATLPVTVTGTTV